MAASPNFVLPYEPDYAGHREAARRREEVAETLRQREELQALEFMTSQHCFGRSSQ